MSTIRTTALTLVASSILIAAAPQRERQDERQDPGSHPVALDRDAIERAVMDYVEGIYQADPARIERSVHEDLTKLGFYRRSETEAFETVTMDYDELIQIAESASYNAGDAPVKKIEIFDVLDRTASARLTAQWGVDFMHLAKMDGHWKIVHVVWQSPPTNRMTR